MATIETKATLPIPSDPAATIVFGMILIFVALGGFVVWATFAPLSEAVIAPGTIKVDSNRKLIQHLEGGTVKEILVRDGDRVAQGDVLVRLDETRAAASLAIVRDGLDAANAQEARLLAERDQLDAIVFPSPLVERLQDPKVAGIVKSQRILWDARKSALEGEVEILKKQVAQFGGDITGYTAQIEANQRQLRYVRDELSSVRGLHKRGLTGKQRLLELEREAARLDGERAELRSDMAATETEISRKGLEIYQVRNSFHESVVNELKQVQAEIYDFRERLNAAEHTFGHTEVRAPVDGVVVSSGIHTIGGVVAPGSTLLEIVPLDDLLIIEAKVDPKDIDNIRPGLPAGVRLTAFNQRNTPELAGELRYVSADALQDKKTGASYFVSRIDVGDEELERLGDRQLQPGMVAEVFIRTGERTMADYLLQPLRDSFSRAWLEE